MTVPRRPPRVLDAIVRELPRSNRRGLRVSAIRYPEGTFPEADAYVGITPVAYQVNGSFFRGTGVRVLPHEVDALVAALLEARARLRATAPSSPAAGADGTDDDAAGGATG